MAPFTTIGVGGSARFFAHVRSESELEEAVAFGEGQLLPLSILGGGSNLLIRDEGFPGLVVHLDIQGEVTMRHEADHVRCDVPAGTPWDDFVLSTCRADLSGVECLAGIPGLTGGTPVQNVGAYGQEVAETICGVRAYDLSSRSFVEIAPEDCRFAYRSSRFNTEENGRFLVTLVAFNLKMGIRPALKYSELQNRFLQHSPTPLDVYNAVRDIRRTKGMLLSPDDPDSRSAGSFFKNPIVSESRLREIISERDNRDEIPHWPIPHAGGMDRSVKLSAAWLVQMSGFAKGFVDGRAGISTRHALALINRGGATFTDIARLRDRVRCAVEEEFGIVLEQEPVELGPNTRGYTSPDGIQTDIGKL